MRKPPGQRGGWVPTQPADTGVVTRPPEHAPLPSRPRSSVPVPVGASPVFQPTRPLTDFQPTRPHTDFQPTRPLTDFQPTRPHTDFQPTRPVSDFQPTRPMDGQHGRAAAPAAAPVPRKPAPPPAPVMAPTTDGHWQVRGGPGQNLVLMPGQMHMGQQVASLRTLLGSCVAITLWHPTRRIGGMCHFLLPQRQRPSGEPTDGRYGDEAVAEMVKVLHALGTQPQEYVAHLYGGADTMSGVSAARFNIGERNIEQGWSLIDRYGFQLDGVDVGEDIPRTVALTLATGVVTMRRGTGHAPDHLRT
jgi:chemotaxis protein CheD